MSRGSRPHDSAYSRNSVGMRFQANTRSYVTKLTTEVLNELDPLVSDAMTRYSRRPLLQNLPKFNQLYRRYQGTIRSFWNTFDKVIYLRDLKNVAHSYEQVHIPNLRVELTHLVIEMNNFLAINDLPTDADLLNLISNQIRLKYEAKFSLINQRFIDILPAASKCNEAIGKIAYYRGLVDAYTDEIKVLLQNVHDQNSIDNLKVVIERNAGDLQKEIEKIEKITAGQELEESFVLSDLSDDSSSSDS